MFFVIGMLEVILLYHLLHVLINIVIWPTKDVQHLLRANQTRRRRFALALACLPAIPGERRLARSSASFSAAGRWYSCRAWSAEVV